MIKRVVYLFAMIALLAASFAVAQDLAAVAREQRAQKKGATTKVITNDDLQSPSPAATPTLAAATPADADKDKAGKDKTAVEADAAKRKEYQEKAADIKKEIDQLQREYTVSEREYKLRAAVYYADAGNSLRDPKLWAEEERKYKAEMADKQKALDDAKQRLADLQEQARKDGVATAAE